MRKVSAVLHSATISIASHTPSGSSAMGDSPKVQCQCSTYEPKYALPTSVQLACTYAHRSSAAVAASRAALHVMYNAARHLVQRELVFRTSLRLVACGGVAG